MGVENPDTVIQQISNMVRDSIKPDITMFIRYAAKNVEGKQIVAVEIQRGTEAALLFGQRRDCGRRGYMCGKGPPLSPQPAQQSAG